MISSSMSGCRVRGDKKGENIKLTFSGNCVLRDASWSYSGYFLVKVVGSIVCVSNITVSPASVSLKTSETEQLSYIVSPSNATNKSVSWSTNNSSVATVSSNGLVTAKGVGSATITCKANDDCGRYTTCTVTVSPIKVTDISLNYTILSLVKGDERQLRATITPSNATDKTVKWTSSNNNVATVSDNGQVTAVGRGKATITCKANDGSGVQATCDVSVSSVKPWTTFTFKTVEGVEMKFYSRNDGTCFVSSPAIDVNTTGPITIPSEAEGLKVTRIDGNSFYNCRKITKVTIPNTVEAIGGNAFQNCSALESAVLGNNLKELEYNTFNNCKSLSAITGISQLEFIGHDAFNNTPWYNNLPDGIIYLGKVLYKYKGTMPDNTTVRINDGS